MKPNQYALYKGTGSKWGAIQFQPQPPHFFNKSKAKDFQGTVDAKNDRAAFTVVDGKVTLKEGWKTRDGCIFLEGTSSVGPNKYDWKQSVRMALSPGDMGKILYFLTTGQSSNKKERTKGDGTPSKSMSIMHDPNARSDRQGEVRKYLEFYSPNGPADGMMLTVKQIAGDDKRSHQIPVTGDEVMVLRSLLASAIPNALSW